MISIAVVTNGPVATAGSILMRAKAMGTNDPTRAATDMEQITAMATEMARASML